MILISTIHDPKGIYFEEAQELKLRMITLFSEIYITVSDATYPEFLDWCQSNFKNVKIIEKNGAADARRRVLEFGLANSNDKQAIFYCDFDRMLTWIETEEFELKEIISQIDSELLADYLVLGREKQAFESHPLSWQDSEKITNKVAALSFDLPNLDITSGAAILTKTSAQYINQSSNYPFTDCEWPLIIKERQGIIAERKVKGLAFRRINRGKEENEAKEYFQRIKLCQSILGVFFKGSDLQ